MKRDYHSRHQNVCDSQLLYVYEEAPVSHSFLAGGSNASCCV